jgi:serine/threonine protein kinase
MLGEGGQAVVLKVFDLRLGVPRALKALLPAAARRKGLRERFVREAELLAQIEHPNVLRVYDVEVDVVLPFFVAEFVTGGSLADRLAKGPMPPRLVCEVVDQMCRGLAVVHAAGIIHRDVKPQNVLVTANGTCKLVDLGIARSEEGGRTRAGLAMGTEGFMPPEQVADAASVDARADVFAAGMVAYVLLAARDPVRWLGGEDGGVPPSLVPILRRATEQDRTLRTPTITAFADELRAAAAALPPDPPGTTLSVGPGPGTGETEEQVRRLAQVRSWFEAPSEPSSGSLSRSGASPRAGAGPKAERPAPPARPGDLTPSVPPAKYIMSRPSAERSEEAPTWLVEEPPAAAQEPAAAAPPAAPARVPPAAAPPPRAEEPERALPQIPWVPLGAAAALLLALIGGLGAYQYQRVVESEVAVFGTLQQLGADPQELEALLTRFERAPNDVERARAAVRIVDHARAESERLTAPGSAQRASLDQVLADMSRAAAAWRAVDPDAPAAP